MRILNEDEMLVVMGAGTAGEIAGSCLAGATAAGTIAAIAGAATAGLGGALTILGGCAGGVVLYYLTD